MDREVIQTLTSKDGVISTEVISAVLELWRSRDLRVGLLTLVNRLIGQYQDELNGATELIYIGRAQGKIQALRSLINGCEAYVMEYERKVNLKAKEESNG